MKEYTYKNYRIKVGPVANQLVAHIWRPNSGLIMSGGTITVSLEEGEDILIQRVEKRINEEEAKENNN